MSEFLPEMPIRVLVAAKLPHKDGALTYRAGGRCGRGSWLLCLSAKGRR